MLATSNYGILCPAMTREAPATHPSSERQVRGTHGGVHMAHEPVNTGQQTPSTACCVVGAGPAGAMLALLLARQGAQVTLVESHMDFDREFRGDSIHPSVLNILDEIGVIDRLLALPHSELRYLEAKTRSGLVRFSDYRWIKCKYPFEFLIAQSRFLDFVTTEAKRYPSFHLMMGTQVNDLVTEHGVVRGVRY